MTTNYYRAPALSRGARSGTIGAGAIAVPFRDTGGVYTPPKVPPKLPKGAKGPLSKLGRKALKFAPMPPQLRALLWFIDLLEMFNKPGQGVGPASGWERVGHNIHPHMANATYAGADSASARLKRSKPSTYTSSTQSHGSATVYPEPTITYHATRWRQVVARGWCNQPGHDGLHIFYEDWYLAPGDPQDKFMVNDPAFAVPMPEEQRIPEHDPQLEPHKVKPLAPMPKPVQVPYRLLPQVRPNPYASPTEQSQRGYRWYPFRSPYFDPHFPELWPNPKKDEIPVVEQTQEVIITEKDKGDKVEVEVVTQHVPGRAGRYHKLTTPGHAKESKVRLTGAALAAYYALGSITELGDYVEVLFRLLPKDIQSKVGRNSPAIQKARAIWDNWSTIDPILAAHGLIENEIEDRIYGTIGKFNAEMNRRFSSHIGVGLQRGSAYRNSLNPNF